MWLLRAYEPKRWRPGDKADAVHSHVSLIWLLKGEPLANGMD